jgi:broad specificity phosphatase PhoE
MLKHRPFYYLRHGQTDWNLEHRAQGQQDVDLNDTGRAQAEAAVLGLLDKGIATICCSPLKRARETASILGKALGVPIVIVEDLKEANWGVREGEYRGAWFSEWRSGAVTPARAEPYDAFLLRALQGINTALECTGPVLIVAHGGIYWAVEKETEIPLGDAVPNCTPVFHEPPSSGRPRWSVEVLERSAGRCPE